MSHYEHIQQYGKHPKYKEARGNNCCTACCHGEFTATLCMCFLGDNFDKEEGGNKKKRNSEKARYWIDKRRIVVGDDK